MEHPHPCTQPKKSKNQAREKASPPSGRDTDGSCGGRESAAQPGPLLAPRAAAVLSPEPSTVSVGSD